MVRRSMALLATGVMIGVVVDRVARELGKPAAEQFPVLRRQMNERVNPWLLDHRYPGSEHAEIGTLEHLGRTSGALHFTPVHPTLRGERLFIPAPLGEGSEWVRNVRQSGHARLQLHDELLDLDAPELVSIADSGMVPAAIAAPFDRMGWRYMRLHVAARVAGSFATHEPTVAGPLHEEAPLDRPFELRTTPLEPVGSG
jgi:F420H(2)-dependent quinone reductase